MYVSYYGALLTIVEEIQCFKIKYYFSFEPPYPQKKKTEMMRENDIIKILCGFNKSENIS